MSDNVAQELAEHVSEQGWDDRVAYLIEDTAWTFGEVFDGAARVAGRYRSAGLHGGDRVVLALPDSVELVCCMLGAWQVGLVAVPVNVQMSRDDLERDVATAEAALIVVDPETSGWLGGTELAPTTTVEQLLTGAPDTRFADGGDAPAVALFTSGTTGVPKLCFYRHSDFDQGDQGSRRSLDAAGTDNVLLSVSRMSFFGGLSSSVLITLAAGLTTVLSRSSVTASAAVSLMRRHDVTGLFAPPSFYARLLLEPGHAEVLGRLRQAMCAGEALSARLREQLVPLLGERLINVYGATEIGGIAIGRPAAYDKPSAVGPVFGARPTRIVDADGRTVPTGEQGELHIRVPRARLGVARGSLGPRHLIDTWWATGDLASIDEDDVLHAHGRLDDVEVISGQNVVPSEVERLLESHPRVLEVAVSATRLPAGDTGLCAYVVAVPEPGGELTESAVSDGDEALGAELIELARSSLSWYKVPQEVVWLDALPRNRNGKVLRRQLRARGDQFV